MSSSTQQFLGIDYSPEERFKQVYESNMVGILFWDMHGGIVEANDKLLNMIGYTREEMLNGKVRWSQITPPEFAYLDEQTCALLLAGLDAAPYEKQYCHKDGHRIDIMLSAAMVKNSKDIGMACILDISAQKQAEESIKKQQEALAEFSVQLAQSNKDLEQFATIIADDFQNPLRKVCSFTQHLESLPMISLEAEAQDDIQRILRLTKKMQNQCQNLLELSRVSRTSVCQEPISMKKLVKDALLDMHYTLKDYGAQVKIGDMVDMKADPLQLKLLIVTMIDTILNFSLQYGLLEMVIHVTKLEHQFYELCFVQNIPDLTQELFENPYAQNTKQERNGINIDIAIIRKIIDRHKGYIRVSPLSEGYSEVAIGFPD